jgi:hypothetical protein
VEEEPRDALREAVGQVPLRAQQRVQRDLHGWEGARTAAKCGGGGAVDSAVVGGRRPGRECANAITAYCLITICHAGGAGPLCSVTQVTIGSFHHTLYATACLLSIHQVRCNPTVS